ncbi:MAG: hypothetical protein JW738_02130 [Actinobacteria bacterium]|nr:hypothetical protein [Actinomycetota bacterium]
MAAAVFEIIAAVFIVLFLFLLIIVLPLINKMLKSVNKSFSERTRDIKKQVNDSIEEFEDVEKEIIEVQKFTEQIKSGLDSGLEAADLAIDFLNSPHFRYGFPATVWLLFSAVALPRGLHVHRRIKVERKIIPPPSWS